MSKWLQLVGRNSNRSDSITKNQVMSRPYEKKVVGGSHEAVVFGRLR